MREVGGLEGAAEDGDCVVLGCNIVEGLGSAVRAVNIASAVHVLW